MSEFFIGVQWVVLTSQTPSPSVHEQCNLYPWNDVCRVATFDHITVYLSGVGGRRSGL